jgi:hypothetical protein
VAAVVVTHGLGCATEPGAGPLFPADVATKMPAVAARRNALCTMLRKSVCVPPTEKLITSTPSAIAWSAAAVKSVCQPFAVEASSSE